MTRAAVKLILAAVLFSSGSAGARSQEVQGDLKQWHRVVIDFQGPATAETADPNPFTDYRLNVTFRGPGDRTLTVPGFYAADGRAAETSATSGGTWRVCFTPDCAGQWAFRASFRTGRNIATSLDPSAGSALSFDGTVGTFAIVEAPAGEDDGRSKGLLRYVGGHYFQYAGNGEYFLKGGANSPENFLAYKEFDDSYDADAGSASYKEVGTFIHSYAPHVADWRPGDPSWQSGKGKGIVGMLNYLAGEGMNSVYFLTYNLDGGDGRDTWMWTSPEVRDRFDCSKLDQWEIVFEHMDRLGLLLHVVTQETENDHKLGGGPGLNPIRKLYYRELVARFGHHLAVLWNLGEENNTSDADRKAIAAYIRALDPYDHPITVHTHNNKALTFYNGILGDKHFEATSIQGNMANYNREAIELRRRSAEAGRKWAIFGDEQPKASHGVLPDANDPTHDIPRKQALWGNLMGGGAGVEWYFGFKFPHMDINCEDWRSRDRMWDQTRFALEFFRGYLPFTDMRADNELTSNDADYCFAKPGEVYAVYLPDGGSTELQVDDATYSVHWYNPRTGGDLQRGSVERITGPGSKSVGQAPEDPDKDWAVLVRKSPADESGTFRESVGLRPKAKLSVDVPGEYTSIGAILPRHARDIKASNWSIGAETMDRDYTIYANWRQYLGPLGVKKARIQSGWAKTEQSQGEYDWAWLDEIVLDMVDQGVEPWVCICYGNPIYEGGGDTGLGGGMPRSEAALAAWDRYVEALVRRYKDHVDEWEVWNEPGLRGANPEDAYADLLMRTAAIIRRHQPDARILGFAMAGVKVGWCADVLRRVEAAGKLHLVNEVTYHPYSYNPSDSYQAVARLRATIGRFSDAIGIRQGENGAPSARGSFGALSKYDWTETSQAKWALRRLLGDLGRDIPSSYFAICDMQYPSRRNYKGLIAIHDDRTVDRPKLGYYAVQHLAAVFDDSLSRITDLDARIVDQPASDRYALFGYDSSRGGSVLTIWRATDTPGKRTATERLTVTADKVSFEEPVWVDLLSGEAFAIDESLWSVEDGVATFTNVPVYDSPILIADRKALPRILK